MDEPTASLGEVETIALMKLVEKLKGDGIGIIYISHHLDEIFKIGDRAIVLKDGRSVSERKMSDTTEEQLIKDMVGRDASGFYHKGNYSKEDHALRLEHFSYKNLVHDVSFGVSRGEIFGLGGLVGAGRTELMQILFGVYKAENGNLYLDGKDITSRNPREAVKNGICFVSEDRKAEGLFLERSTKENIILTKNESLFLLKLKEETIEVEKSIKQLNIKVFNQQHEVGKLSGGNQQKVVISRWLSMNGEVYIFDEPTKGVDVGAREEIYRLMEGLAKAGKVVIMVSSNMPELISMSDRIGVMKDGYLKKIISAKEASEDKLLKLYMDVEG
ncbi:MAG: sugar transporter ATP-binding protein [Clostridiales bacterium]|nr:sugar transporter ATP-binding protein [Clostridiales bacterium]